METLKTLYKRYAEAFRHAWQQRKELTPKTYLPHEAQFLPAALSLQETPVSPLPRVIMWLLIAFALIALVWAIFGKIDIVATAQGKIIASDRTKVIQPIETATVKAIHITDGQTVQAGDMLIELDSTLAKADVERNQNDLTTAKLQAARYQAFLTALEGKQPVINKLPDIDIKRITTEQTLLDSQYLEYQSKLQRIDAEKNRRAAELASTQEIVKKLEQTAPIAKKRAEDFRNLAAQNFVSKHGYLEREQIRIEQEADLANQKSKLAEIRAALMENSRQKANLVAETKRITLDALNEAQQKIATLSQELIKAEQRNKLLRLTAPVEGTVQQLAVHTIGGVVTPAQPLLMIVPKDNPIEVEAFLENKDIGFVNAAQEAQIKVETFPFTKYGTIPALVISVSNDAINDEKRGLIYSAKFTLSRGNIRVENKTVNLTPGMAVTAEIKTGQRRVIEYFLSPLLQYKDESLRER